MSTSNEEENVSILHWDSCLSTHSLAAMAMSFKGWLHAASNPCQHFCQQSPGSAAWHHPTDSRSPHTHAEQNDLAWFKQ